MVQAARLAALTRGEVQLPVSCLVMTGAAGVLQRPLQILLAYPPSPCCWSGWSGRAAPSCSTCLSPCW